MCKTKGRSTDWVNEIPAKGKMWCTPGPYLRRSMLLLLSRECGDHFLPEVFYKEQTFDEQGQGNEKERDMARDMRDSMLLSSRIAGKDSDDDESSEDDDERSETIKM
jgi:hypothetical protein